MPVEENTSSVQGKEAIKESILKAESNVEDDNKTEKDAELTRNEIIENLEIKTEEEPEPITPEKLEVLKQQIAEKDKSIEVLQRQQLAEKDKSIEDLQRQISSFSEKSIQDRKKALEEEKQQIIQQQKDSVDDEEWTRLENKRGEIDKELYSTPAKTEVNQQSNDPVLLAWANNNKWFSEDRVLGGYATAVDAEIIAKSPYMSTKDRLDKVKTEVKARFPEKFGIEPDKINNRRITAHSSQKVGISLEDDAKTHKFYNLPEEAKKAYLMIFEPDGMTKETYIKDYYND